MRVEGFRRLTIPLLAASLGCSTEATAPLPRPASVDIVLGEHQLGHVGEDALPLLVRVTDGRGDGFEGAEVTYTVVSGSGVLGGERDGCDDPLPAVAVTSDAEGYAWVSLTPAWFGSTRVEAEVDSLPPAVFTATTSGREATLEPANAYEQEVIAGPQRSQDLSVLLLGRWGHAAPDVPVTWVVTSGEARLRGGTACSWTSADSLVARTTPGSTGAPGYSAVVFEPRAFGPATVTAGVAGISDRVTFSFDVTTFEICLCQVAFDRWELNGPDYTSDATVPVGARVEWVSHAPDARIVSTSAPPGGTPFDSGPMSQSDRFQFVPDAPGTWEYEDRVRGITGTLTAS